MLYLLNNARVVAVIHGEDEIPQKHQTQRTAGLGDS